MSDPAGLTRVPHSDRSGTGLSEWERMDPDSLVSGTPVQRGWLCDEDAASGYLAGVWDCTAFVDRPAPYSVDEFMLLLEGSVIVAMPDGTETEISAGQAFVVPKGLDCQWKQPGYVRKIFMIVDDPVPERPAAGPLDRVILPDLGTAGGRCFLNAAGRMSVSVLDAGGANGQGDGAHRLLHVLDGALEVAGGDGEARLGAGESAYLRAGHGLIVRPSTGARLVEARYAAG